MQYVLTVYVNFVFLLGMELGNHGLSVGLGCGVNNLRIGVQLEAGPDIGPVSFLISTASRTVMGAPQSTNRPTVS
jgi:hypothetical protein